MTRIIEARAVISAADKTGQVFDAIAKKMRGVAAAGKEIEKIKPLPKWLGNMEKDLAKFKLTEKEMAGVARRQREMYDIIRGSGAATQMRIASEWRSQELAHWKKIRSGVDEAALAQKRFIAGATKAGAAGFAFLGGGYAAYRVGKAGIKANAEGARESARDYLAGMTDAESKRIKDAAMAASGRFPSVDANTMHERLRDTAMSTRSTDKAVELSDTIGQMTTVLQSLKGKDKAIEEGRKFFAALDVLGKNVDPKEIRELANGFVKAVGVEGADMDLGGVLQFARQSRAAGGILSNRFLMQSMPGLARDLGDAQLGTSLASALGQNIGGRATDKSKEAQAAFGLRDKDGKFLDSRMAMADPDRYAWEKLAPAMQKKGVDVSDNVAVTKALAQLFSNRTVQDVFSKLVTQREQYQGKAAQYEKAPGLDAAGPLMRKDPFVALEAVEAQLRNFATLAPVMESATSGLNSLAAGITTLNGAVGGSDWLKKLPDSAGKWFENEKRDAVAIGGAIGRVFDVDKAVTAWGKGLLEGPGSTRLGTRKPYEAPSRWPSSSAAVPFVDAAPNMSYAPAAGYFTSGAARLGGGRRIAPPSFASPGITEAMLHGTGVGGGGGTVQATLTGSADVHGEATLTIKVEAPELIRAYHDAQKAISLAGRLNTNGPGSTGRSSPDTQAPGGTGFGGGGM